MWMPAATQYAGTLPTYRTLMGERRFEASRRPLSPAAMRRRCASELFPPTSAATYVGELELGTAALRCRSPLAIRTQASATFGVCFHMPHSVCGLLVLCAVHAAVLLLLFDARVVRELGGRLRSRTSSAGAALEFSAALWRARALPRDW